MATSVLNSPKAVDVSVFIVRAFVRMRQFVSEHMDLARKLDELGKKLQTHDSAIKTLVNAIRGMIAKPVMFKRQIGFHADLDKKYVVWDL